MATLENALKIYRSLEEDAPHEERVEAYDKVTDSYRTAASVAKDRDDVDMPEISDEARARFVANDPRNQRPGTGTDTAPVNQAEM